MLLLPLLLLLSVGEDLHAAGVLLKKSIPLERLASLPRPHVSTKVTPLSSSSLPFASPRLSSSSFSFSDHFSRRLPSKTRRPLAAALPLVRLFLPRAALHLPVSSVLFQIRRRFFSPRASFVESTQPALSFSAEEGDSEPPRRRFCAQTSSALSAFSGGDEQRKQRSADDTAAWSRERRSSETAETGQSAAGEEDGREWKDGVQVSLPGRKAKDVVQERKPNCEPSKKCEAEEAHLFARDTQHGSARGVRSAIPHWLFRWIDTTAWNGQKNAGDVFSESGTTLRRLTALLPLEIPAKLKRSALALGAWIAPSVGVDFHPASGGVSLAAEFLPSFLAVTSSLSFSPLFPPPLLSLSLSPDGVLRLSGGVDLRRCILLLLTRLASLGALQKTSFSAVPQFLAALRSPALASTAVSGGETDANKTLASRVFFGVAERRLCRLSRLLCLQVEGCIDTLRWRYTERAWRCVFFFGEMPSAVLRDRRKEPLCTSWSSLSPFSAFAPACQELNSVFADKDATLAWWNALWGQPLAEGLSPTARLRGVCTPEHFDSHPHSGEYLFQIGQAFLVPPLREGARKKGEEKKRNRGNAERDETGERPATGAREEDEREAVPCDTSGEAGEREASPSRRAVSSFHFGGEKNKRNATEDAGSARCSIRERRRKTALCVSVEGDLLWSSGSAALAFDVNKWRAANRGKGAFFQDAEDHRTREKRDSEGERRQDSEETMRVRVERGRRNCHSRQEPSWGVFIDLGTLHIRVKRLLLRLETC
ncbi:hypothetical protein TGPRC2_366950 [Toxoplasma gondii TgCatPRC2]|uniref:Transmembrane protein n=3 Tax=Toxoplasma gondii TaxID=5811 RepID=V4Z538_TOXGV|nr:hypothetical protein TGVEG_366950 [Toxoplasma gondii VEG]KYF44754.1 hypothetical protein TGARI_366950 [Toxoplasma gondii ARI]KYK64599.1 hypothetical protein TGPRC2_366950 [Toxoplasma gondii TgCatPRC2]CEL76228.1 TPA: hypothetical protein BN1205_107195 [Toxoplasma gondii VEG]